MNYLQMFGKKFGLRNIKILTITSLSTTENFKGTIFFSIRKDYYRLFIDNEKLKLDYDNFGDEQLLAQKIIPPLATEYVNKKQTLIAKRHLIADTLKVAGLLTEHPCDFDKRADYTGTKIDGIWVYQNRQKKGTRVYYDLRNSLNGIVIKGIPDDTLALIKEGAIETSKLYRHLRKTKQLKK